MRLVRVAVLVLLASGCHEVFGLAPRDLPPVCGPELLDGRDDDGDAVLNEDDPCPLLALEARDDEDGDGVPDDCDACPQLLDPGVDPECDGIGSACDPDDGIAHERRFYGFTSGRGFRAYNSALADGQLVMTQKAPPLSTSNVVMDARASTTASYEAGGTVANLVEQFQEIAITVDDGAREYRLSIEKHARGQSFAVIKLYGTPSTDLARLSIGTFPLPHPGEVPFKLVAHTTSSGIEVQATFGDFRGGVSVDAQSAPLAASDIEYGFLMYRDPDVTETVGRLEYFQYTAPRAP